ncbi:MAG: hypothetical protein DHS20C02_14710 [Micavibrio sp.]|nr:MAG: hypothetical protein DHS20C02_14710 [Micavibrio sp.]
MFSSVSSIFATKPREAESTDTRLGIRRHDPDQEQPKRKKKDDEEATFFNEGDEATVSIEALQIFLENFLHSLLETTGMPAAPANNPAQHTQKMPMKSHDGPAAHAANAYQSTSYAVNKETHFDSAPGQNKVENLDIGLESHEVRMIYALLADLKILAQQNVQTLHIERGNTFLLSLAAAVEKSKMQHN